MNNKKTLTQAEIYDLSFKIDKVKDLLKSIAEDTEDTNRALPYCNDYFTVLDSLDQLKQTIRDGSQWRA